MLNLECVSVDNGLKNELNKDGCHQHREGSHIRVAGVKAVAKIDDEAVLAKREVHDSARNYGGELDVHAHRRARCPGFPLEGKLGVRQLRIAEELAEEVVPMCGRVIMSGLRLKEVLRTRQKPRQHHRLYL